MTGLHRYIDTMWLELCEKDDRTSPEEYPDMVLITKDELTRILEDALNDGGF